MSPHRRVVKVHTRPKQGPGANHGDDQSAGRDVRLLDYFLSAVCALWLSEGASGTRAYADGGKSSHSCLALPGASPALLHVRDARGGFGHSPPTPRPYE